MRSEAEIKKRIKRCSIELSELYRMRKFDDLSDVEIEELTVDIDLLENEKGVLSWCLCGDTINSCLNLLT